MIGTDVDEPLRLLLQEQRSRIGNGRARLREHTARNREEFGRRCAAIYQQMEQPDIREPLTAIIAAGFLARVRYIFAGFIR